MTLTLTPPEWRPPSASSRQERVSAHVMKILAEARMQLHVKKTCAICMLGMSCDDGVRLARRFLLAKLQHVWWATEPQRLRQRCMHCGDEAFHVFDCLECEPLTLVEGQRCLLSGLSKQ